MNVALSGEGVVEVAVEEATSAEREASVAEWRTAMAAVLNRTLWDRWAVLTFRRETRDGRPLSLWRDARVLATRWLNGCQCARREPLAWFAVLEGREEETHVHLLIANAYPFAPEEMAATWTHGKAEVAVYDARRDGVRYVLKEQSPHDNAWRWSMSPPLPARVRQRLRVVRGHLLHDKQR